MAYVLAQQLYILYRIDGSQIPIITELISGPSLDLPPWTCCIIIKLHFFPVMIHF
jgi:hypothetical protein